MREREREIKYTMDIKINIIYVQMPGNIKQMKLMDANIFYVSDKFIKNGGVRPGSAAKLHRCLR
jgi:hypothetical protein